MYIINYFLIILLYYSLLIAHIRIF